MKDILHNVAFIFGNTSSQNQWKKPKYWFREEPGRN